MNNIKELERTRKAIRDIFTTYCTTQYVPDELEEKRIAIKALKISYKTGVISFHDDYKVLLWKRPRTRLNVIAICALVTLYKMELKSIMPNENIQIPYDLKGFWNMGKVTTLLQEFAEMQRRLCTIFQWEKTDILKEDSQSSQLEDFYKVLKEVADWKIVTQYDKQFISYGENSFELNMWNVRRNVVPLCKMLTEYCWRTISTIDSYHMKYYNRENYKMDRALELIFDFMELKFGLRTF